MKSATTEPTRPLPAQRAREIASLKLGYRIPRSTFYRMIQDGRILTLRVGSKVLVPREALENFVKRCFAGERY